MLLYYNKIILYWSETFCCCCCHSTLVIREPFNEIPPRVDYTLTKDGESLRDAITPILRWAISKKGTVTAHCSCSMIEKGKKLVI
ncbi:MAG TPA: winged helix-turn-helix transcriptional regulator [Nitrososphaeraceae archaeon]